MFDFLTPGSEDAIGILKHDHAKVKELFEQFEKAEDLRQKKKIAAETIRELKIHAALEEEIFYAAVRKQVDKLIMTEADEEHHVAKVLIAELEIMSGTENHYEAKYKVLAENVRHHIREEETDMLPRARRLDIDFNALGKRMLARKQQLLKTGLPKSAEEKMVALAKGRTDSPAEAARSAKAAPARPSRVIKLTQPVKAAAKGKRKPAPKARGNTKQAAGKRAKPAPSGIRGGKKQASRRS